MSERLARFARRVEQDSFFLAAVLASYTASVGLDDAGLAQVLGCPLATLDALRLCRRPHPEPEVFRADVERIAGRFGVDAGVLAQIIRYADALSALRAAADRGTLLAARDREDEHD